MADKEKLIDRVADALYEQALQEARESIDKVPFDAKELPGIFSRLQTESETAQILVFGSYLEDRIQSLIKAQLLNLTSGKAEDAVFGSNGPLNTFGSRLTLSYHLGWLSSRQKTKLDAVRKIRNEFAHRAFKVRFSEPDIAAHFSTIDYDVRTFLTLLRKADETDPFVADADITKSAENLCNLALLASHTFMDYLVLPSAHAFRVNPNDIAKRDGFDKAPKVIRELHREISRTLLGLLAKPDIGPIE